MKAANPGRQTVVGSPALGKPECPERSSDWEDLRGLMTLMQFGPGFKEAKVESRLQYSPGVGSEANHGAFDSVRKKDPMSETGRSSQREKAGRDWGGLSAAG